MKNIPSKYRYNLWDDEYVDGTEYSDNFQP